MTNLTTSVTPTAGDCSQSVATTAFVQGELVTAATPDASSSSKGKVQLLNDLVGTADNPITPTAVHLTGAEIVSGAKNFTAGLNAGVGARSTAGATVINGTAVNVYYHVSRYGVIEVASWRTAVSKIRVNPAGGNFDIGNGDPNSTVHSFGSFATAVTARSAATTLDAIHCSVEVNTTATQTLPALKTCQGCMYEFVNINAAAATIKGSGTELIGNVTTATTNTLPSGSAVTLKAFPSA